jgi:hypothetical protein
MPFSEHVRRPLNESAHVEALPHVPNGKRTSGSSKIGPNAGEYFFNTIGPKRILPLRPGMSAFECEADIEIP